MQQENKDHSALPSPLSSISYWQRTAPAIHLSSELPSHAHVVVIGGGIVGASTCYWLAKMGLSVVLCERSMLAHGATGRNAGFVSMGTAEPYDEAIARLGHPTAQAVFEITRENQRLLRTVIAEENIVCDYREPGHLSLALDEQQWKSSQTNYQLYQEDGISSHLLERADLSALIHTPLGPEICGGWFIPERGLVHSVRLVQGVTTAAQRYGAHIVTAELLDITPQGQGVQIRTTAGHIDAEAVVLATNAWLPRMVPEVQHAITPVRGQMLAYEPLAPTFLPAMFAHITPTEEYWQQTQDGTIVLGGCRAVASGHDRGVLLHDPTEEVQAALEQVLPRLFPQIARLRVSQRWAGPMAFTHDFLPVVDRLADLPVWFAGGFCGHGMPFGIRFGQLLAEAAFHKSTPRALFPFRLKRPTLV